MLQIARAPQPGPIAQRIIRALPALFMIWLLVAVVGPWDLYETVFHALIIPAAMVTWRYTIGSRLLEDRFIQLAGMLFLYTAISTHFVGPGSFADDLKITRWSIEAFFSVITLWICVQSAFVRPALWGRLILGMSIIGAGLAFALWDNGRIEGLGALNHPIQGASILIAYLALGVVLLSKATPRWQWRDFLLILLSCTSVASFVFMSESRGPMLAFAIFIFILFPAASATNFKWVVILLLIVLTVTLGVIEWNQGLDTFLSDLVNRADSQRLDIWKGYMLFPPDSLLFGYGASVRPEQMHAAEQFWAPNGYVITHAHNLWLGTYAETGLVGVAFLLAMVSMLVWASITRVCAWHETSALLGIVALVLMLTFTDEHTLVLSMKPIWLLAWLPMILVWQWTRRNDSEDYS